jgi:hypothetical protein
MRSAPVRGPMAARTTRKVVNLIGPKAVLPALLPLTLVQHGPELPGRDSAPSMARGKEAILAGLPREAHERVPLHFEPNQGQADSAVRFILRGGGYTTYLTDAESVMVLRGTAPRQRLRGSPLSFLDIVARSRATGCRRVLSVSGISTVTDVYQVEAHRDEVS